MMDIILTECMAVRDESGKVISLLLGSNRVISEEELDTFLKGALHDFKYGSSTNETVMKIHNFLFRS